MLSVFFADGSVAKGRIPLHAERTSVRRTYIFPEYFSLNKKTKPKKKEKDIKTELQL